LKQYFESIESGNYGQILHGIWLHCVTVIFILCTCMHVRSAFTEVPGQWNGR